MTRLRVLAVAIVGLAVRVHAQSSIARSPVPGAPASVTAFVDVAVVPMDQERVLSNQTVLVQNGWITALGPVRQVKVPAEAVRIDGRGKYLIPGLADMHAHGLPLSRPQAEKVLSGWLADGITTIRIMGVGAGQSPYDGSLNSLLELRARAAKGEISSPRLYLTGSGWGVRERRQGNWPPLDSVASYVAAYQAAGWDHLKVRVEKSAVFDSISAASRRLGFPFAGHVPYEVDLERALASGIRSIEHLTGYMREKIGGTFEVPDTSAARVQALVETTKRAGVWNTPTLAIQALKGEHVVAVSGVFIRAFQAGGVGMLLGTDARSIHEELQILVRVGLTPYQALVTGTRNVADFYGILDSTGTISVGKRADLVLLNGNPLEDIRNTAQPPGIMIGGRWLPR